MQQPLYIQFSQAGKLNYLITNLAPFLTIDPMEFYTNYFNLATCNTDGLNNWGKILNVPRAIPNLNPAFFGWGTEYPAPTPLPPAPIYPQNWNNGTWTTTEQINNNSAGFTDMSDTVYREVLFLTYQSYNINYSIVALNRIVNKFVKAWNESYSVTVQNDKVNVIHVA